MQDPGADVPSASLRSFLEDLQNAIAVARTLVESGHAVDLTGFDRQVGLLCAQALDLPPEQGRDLRDDLRELLASVDALSCALSSATPRS